MPCLQGDGAKAEITSEVLSLVAEENEYRHPQSDNTQRVRDLGTLSPQADVSIKSLFRIQGSLQRRRWKECKKPEGVEDTKKIKPSKSTESTHMLTHRASIHKACMGLYQMGSNSWKEKWTPEAIFNR